MNGLLERLRNSLADNLTLKILAFVIAVTMVRMSKVNSSNKVRSIEVPYQLTITEADRVFLRPPPSSVIVTLRTTDIAMWRLDESAVKAVKKELSGKDNRWLRIDKRDLDGIPMEWVEKIEPEKFLVSFEAVVERPVKVEVRLEGQVQGGYKFVGAEVEPASVQVTGPQSLVSKINGMRTRSVSLVGRSRSIRLPVSLEPPPYGVGLATPGQQVDVNLQIEEQRGTKSFQNIPIKLIRDNDKDIVTASPDTIDLVVSGTLSKLRALEQKEIEVWIDVDQAAVDEETELMVAVDVPADFEIVEQLPSNSLVLRKKPVIPKPPPVENRPDGGEPEGSQAILPDAGVE